MSSSIAEILDRYVKHRVPAPAPTIGTADCKAPDPKKLLLELEILDLRLSIDKFEVAILRRALKAAIARPDGSCAPAAEKIETLDQLFGALARPVRTEKS